jgi:hypothetical protein
LDQGYHYIDNDIVTPAYSGTYQAIFGNIEEEAIYINIQATIDFIEIRLLDQNEALVKKYYLSINNVYSSSTLDQALIKTTFTADNLVIDDLEETLLEIELEKGEMYNMNLMLVENNGEEEDIDLVFYYLNEDLLSRKSIYENLAFTTMIFAIISGGTILSAKILKKD